jgi:hypothetical protein
VAVHVTFPGGDLVRVPTGDDAAMDSVLHAAHLLGGWRFVERAEAMLQAHVERNRRALAGGYRPQDPALAPAVRQSVQAALAELEENLPALRAWSAARPRLGRTVHYELELVEKLARKLALDRLDVSAAQIQAQAGRYLIGFDQTIFASDRLVFPRTVGLKAGATEATPTGPRDPVGDLRANAHTLARAEAAANAADAFGALATAVAAAAGVVVLAITGIASVQQAVARGVRLAALRDQLASEHPVLYRMDLPGSMTTGRVDPPSDKELLASLTGALSATWDAQRAVRRGVEALVWASWYERHPAGPAAGLAEALRNRGMRGGLASLLDPAFGPWAFQQVLADAVTDMAGPGPSHVRQAVHDVYQAVDPSLAASFGEVAAATAALLTLHLVAPPLAVVADIVLAVKGILEAVLAYLRDRDAYRCALDPSEALGVAPSTLRAALQCAGEIAGALPGGKIATTVSVLAPITAGLVP